MKALVSAIAIAVVVAASPVNAASFGRSSSVSVSRSVSTPSRSFSAPSAPSKPSVAPSAPSKPTYFGSSGNMGVQKTIPSSPTSTSTPSQSASWSKPATPSYTPAPAPSYSAPVPSVPSNTSTFMSSMGGSFVGSMLGNAISRPHVAPTTVVTSGGTGSTIVSDSGVSHAGVSSVSNSGSSYGPVPSNKSSYGVFNFMFDLIGVLILIGLIGGTIFFARRFIRNYRKEQKGSKMMTNDKLGEIFWKIQDAFATADANTLKSLMTYSLAREATANMEPFDLTLKNLRHEVYMNEGDSFTVKYTFDDGDTLGVVQYWHFEFDEDGNLKLAGVQNQ